MRTWVSHGFTVSTFTLSPVPNLSSFQTSPRSLATQYKWPSKTSRLYGLPTSQRNHTRDCQHVALPGMIKLLFFRLNISSNHCISRHLQIYIYIPRPHIPDHFRSLYLQTITHIKKKESHFPHCFPFRSYKLISGNKVTRHPKLWPWSAIYLSVKDENTLPRLPLWKTPKARCTCEVQGLVSIHLGYYYINCTKNSYLHSILQSCLSHQVSWIQ